MRTLAMTTAITGLLFVAACTPTSHVPAPRTTQSASRLPSTTTTVSSARDASPASVGVWFVPSALSACGKGTDVVDVHWDVSSYPSVTMVHVMISDADGSEALFATAAPASSKPSGPWMHAGSTLVVRNAANGAELARASVGSLACPAPAR